MKPIRASLRSGDALTQAIQGNVRCAASQLTDKSAVLKEAAFPPRIPIGNSFQDVRLLGERFAADLPGLRSARAAGHFEELRISLLSPQINLLVQPLS